MKYSKIISVLCIMAFFSSCSKSEKDYDATGTFEATETVVYAKQSGTLLKFDVSEGDVVDANTEVALIDTTDILLKIHQVNASKAVILSQKPDIERQIASLREQLAKARKEQTRYKELVADGAAPRKMLDDATSQVQVLEKQLSAQMSSLQISTQSLEKQSIATDVQVSQLNEELRKCHVIVPCAGTVAEKYVECGEFVVTGKPLFKIADIQNIYLRAYVTSAQLAKIKVGDSAKVYADFGNEEKKTYDGKVTWISSHSEFTPKTILTDDERADLVYAVKIAIKNDGYAKIGMYGEVKFNLVEN